MSRLSPRAHQTTAGSPSRSRAGGPTDARAPKAAADDAHEAAPGGWTRAVRGVGSALTSVRDRVWSHLNEVIVVMERDVMSAASAVMGIASETRTQIEQSKRLFATLGNGKNGSISHVLGAQSNMVNAHVEDMTTRVRKQDEKARAAASEVASISALARQIARMASEAKLLALNARIQASQLTVQAPGFTVVAVEMMRLSVEVAAANERIEAIAELLGGVLPELARDASSLRGRVESFGAEAASHIGEVDRRVAEMQEQVTTVVRGADSVLESVVEQSQAALSHLGFQDVAAQRLRRIDATLHDAQVEIANALDDDDGLDAIEPPRHAELGGEKLSERPALAAGEIEMF